MTIYEASERYNIPVEILQEYENWGLCGVVKTIMGAWQYDDEDIQCLSIIMRLHDAGFSNSEAEAYMRLLLEEENTEQERLALINRHRDSTLDEIHLRQKQLDCLDCLRYRIQKKSQMKPQTKGGKKGE